jgi:hypothetical protein
MPNLVYRGVKGSNLTPDEGDANMKALNIYSAIESGAWRYVPPIFRIYVSGTGSITIDAKNPAGVITTSVYTGSLSGANGEILYPYLGDDASQMRVTFTGSLTGEVI